MKYFRSLPLVPYGDKLLRNIISNSRFVPNILEKYEVFFPYRIKEGERADYIAKEYYGDANYTWLIYLANGIVDPYYDWPLDDNDFHRTLMVKYAATIPSIKQMIDHYYYFGREGNTSEEVARVTWKMSPETFELLDEDDQSGWVAKYVYDVEREANEAKRNIRLLSKRYLTQITRELVDSFKS